MCFSFTSCYFATRIIHIKYRKEMSPWNAAHIVMFTVYTTLNHDLAIHYLFQKGSHITFAAGVDSRQGHPFLWTANPSHFGLA